MRVTISRKAHFNAAHRLYRADWSMEKNDSVFGKCNNPNFHGHNYDMIVSVTGEVDPETGYVMDVKILSDLIKEEIENEFDHKNLNLDVPEFKELNPTAENIAKFIFEKMTEADFINDNITISMVKIWETPKSAVCYRG